MKHLFILICLLLLYHTLISAQDIAFSNTAFTHLSLPNDDDNDLPFTHIHHPHKHLSRTYVGEVLMIGGSAILATSIIGIATAQSETQSAASQQIEFALIGICGLPVMITGIPLFSSGKHAERDIKHHLSITGKRNRLGLAFNF